MKRREFVRGSVAAWVGSSLQEGKWLAQDLRAEESYPDGDSRIEIENPYYLVAVDTENGAIVKLLDKRSGVNLISEPRLADNFRLLIPLPDLEANYILGREQQLALHEKGHDSLNLTWKGRLVNPQGSFDVTVSMTIRLVGPAIEFSLKVRNQTPQRIAEVWYPILGGFTGIGDCQDYDPDPRLGTWDELAEGVRACHQMGVRVYFFANIQPVRIDTDWYKRELYRYTSRDRWGVDYQVMGWGMGTLSARLGYTRPALIGECTGIPEFRKIIVAKMRKLAEIGADGVHIDKLWPHLGLDFNPLFVLGNFWIPNRFNSKGQMKCAIRCSKTRRRESARASS
jgi:hypothetical protein